MESFELIQVAKFRRGDSNDDGTVDLSDVTHELDFLFLKGPTPGCMDSADSNDSGAVDISDAVFSLFYLFQGVAMPPPGAGVLAISLHYPATIPAATRSHGTGNTALSQPGRRSGGAQPLVRHREMTGKKRYYL